MFLLTSSSLLRPCCVLLYRLQYCRIVQRTGFDDVKMKVSSL